MLLLWLNEIINLIKRSRMMSLFILQDLLTYHLLLNL